jgi:HK97 family phage prohead protease
MLTKSFPVQVKTGPDDGLAEGEFKAYVSIFGNKDSYGDVVIPGAFTDTLAEWKASGNPLPVVWSHMYSDPDYHIGVTVDATEDDKGLLIHGKLDLDAEATKARQVYRLLKGRRVTQFSFSYDLLDYAEAKNEEFGSYWELRKLKLYETGPTLIGANQETDLVAVKSMRDLAVNLKAGRVLSAKNEEQLRAAADAIKTVLDSLPTDEDKSAAAAKAAAQALANGAPHALEIAGLLELDLLEYALA